jgi:hypothetical protein
MDKMMEETLTYMKEELKTIELLLSENKGGSTYIINKMDILKKKRTVF